MNFGYCILFSNFRVYELDNCCIVSHKSYYITYCEYNAEEQKKAYFYDLRCIDREQKKIFSKYFYSFHQNARRIRVQKTKVQQLYFIQLHTEIPSRNF